jgi:SecD/SecF fusion protein
MSRAALLRALLAIGILALSAYYAITAEPRLGLDLRGGTQIVLETRDTSTAKADKEATDRTLEVLRRRIDALGVSEPSLTRSGKNRIIVELPGVQDPAKAAEVIGRTAQLTIRPVRGVEADPPSTPTPTPNPTPSRTPTGSPAPSTTPLDPATAVVLPDESGERLALGPAALSGTGIGDAEAGFDASQGLGWYVTVDFRGSGERAWEKVTGKAACAQPGDPRRRVAIVLDREIVSAPQVNQEVVCDVGITGGSTQITGGFSPSEAKELALLVRAGALPVPVETVEQRTVGPTLGATAIRASAEAAVIGVTLTVLFLLVVYRLSGLVAAIALGGYGLISYAALTGLGATLTLPGLAGFVLAIGMAIDGCVLIFERAREEYGGKIGLRAAVDGGFRNAFSAIADSNVTTLLAAGLLFFLASGPVQGFGVTLSIGVLASMVSSLLLTRVLIEALAASRFVRARPSWTGLHAAGRVQRWITARGPDLMRHRKRWLALSLLTVTLALTGIGVRGIDLGVEFTGGRLMEYTTTTPVSVDRARDVVGAAGFPSAVVAESGDGKGTTGISVRTERIGDAEESRIRAALADAGGGAERVRDEQIGPSLGSELRTKALIGLGIALLAQMVYLAIRFRWTFALASVAAMTHDVLAVIGVFAWLGRTMDGVFLAALLTVIGYSVNDSVVIFDRIRERWRGANRKTPFAGVANEAVLSTIPRTVNTGLGALFVLGALFFLGGDSLEDFALALLVGIVVGTLSSVFTATPLAVVLEGRWGGPAPRLRRQHPARPRSIRDSGAVV